MTSNKGEDQPAHPHRLIIAFLVLFLDRKYDIVSCFRQKSNILVTGWACWLAHCLVRNPRTGFLATRPWYMYSCLTIRTVISLQPLPELLLLFVVKVPLRSYVTLRQSFYPINLFQGWILSSKKCPITLDQVRSTSELRPQKLEERSKN